KECVGFARARFPRSGGPPPRAKAQLSLVRLVFAVPVVQFGPGAGEEDALAGDAAGADLAGVEVLDDVRLDDRREHQNADRRVRVVPDLMRALLTARKRYDVTFAQLLLAFVRAQRRPAAHYDDPLLVRMVRVVRPETVAGLQLVHAAAEQL